MHGRRSDAFELIWDQDLQRLGGLRPRVSCYALRYLIGVDTLLPDLAGCWRT
jgi:hypothetical protein